MTTPADGSQISDNSSRQVAPTAVGYRPTTDHVTAEDLASRLATPPKLPEQIGGYRITGVLGEGGMGVVYQAVQLSLERTVALKVVRGDLARKQAFVGRFLREAKVAARIDHPNVVTIYDTGEADGHLYMALQYVPGGDLGSRIKSHGKLNEDEALRIIAGCAKGLIAIHGAGLVHRDIKPSNIFLTVDGTPKIGDLGLARNIIDDEKLTFTGDLVGTPSYMAPEQAKGAQDIDHRADIYSLGTSLYHLLTGRPPFQGSSPFLIGHQVIAEVPQDPRELNRAMSPVVAAIIHHAMRKDRTVRYQSAEELLVDVELVRSGKLPRFARVTVMDEERRAETGSLARVPLTPAEAGGQRSFVPVAVGAGMLVGVAVALAVGLGLAQRESEPPPTIATTPFPSTNASVPLRFPPTPDLPASIQEDAPSDEFLAANEPVDRPLARQPQREVRPAPHAFTPPPPRPVGEPADKPAPAKAPVVAPTPPATPPPIQPATTAPAPVVAETTSPILPPAIEQEPPIPATVDDNAALRVVREAVVRVPLDGSAPTQPAPVAPAVAAPARNNLGPTSPAVAPTPAPSTPEPPPVVATTVATTPPPTAPATPPALVEAPIDQALATTPTPPAAVEVAALPTVDTAPAWAAKTGADRYGSWADLALDTSVQRFRLCPAGPAQIGSPASESGRRSDETAHRVTIDQPYWLAETECTQGLWRTVMGDNPSSTVDDHLPVDRVSFQRVQEFIARAAQKKPGVTLRLPSESEWEAACRAGTRGPFTGGLDPRKLAWYRVTAIDRILPVAGRQPNAYGLYDVHGNVWEWCADVARTYPPDVDGLPIATHAYIFRGGSFADPAEDCRAARRGGNQTGEGAVGVGFRLAISATMR